MPYKSEEEMASSAIIVVMCFVLMVVIIAGAGVFIRWGVIGLLVAGGVLALACFVGYRTCIALSRRS